MVIVRPRAGIAFVSAATSAVIIMRCDSDLASGGIPLASVLRSIQLPHVMPGYLGRVLGGDDGHWFGSAPAQFLVGAWFRTRLSGATRRSPREWSPYVASTIHFDWLVFVCGPWRDAPDPLWEAEPYCLLAVAWEFRHRIEVHPPFFRLACRRIEDGSGSAICSWTRQCQSHRRTSGRKSYY
jgi:hypothetical protein